MSVPRRLNLATVVPKMQGIEACMLNLMCYYHSNPGSPAGASRGALYVLNNVMVLTARQIASNASTIARNI